MSSDSPADLPPAPAPAPANPAPASAPAVRVSGLSYRYPDGRLALRGVDLTIVPGEAVVTPRDYQRDLLIV